METELLTYILPFLAENASHLLFVIVALFFLRHRIETWLTQDTKSKQNKLDERLTQVEKVQQDRAENYARIADLERCIRSMRTRVDKLEEGHTAMDNKLDEINIKLTELSTMLNERLPPRK